MALPHTSLCNDFVLSGNVLDFPHQHIQADTNHTRSGNRHAANTFTGTLGI